MISRPSGVQTGLVTASLKKVSRFGCPIGLRSSERPVRYKSPILSPVNTVKARMFQARIKLRNLLPKLGGFAESKFSGGGQL